MNNPTPPINDDDDAQGATSTHKSDSDDLPWYEGGGVLPESEEDGGIPLTFDNEFEGRVHKTAALPDPTPETLATYALAGAIRELADAIRSSTNTVITRDDGGNDTHG